MGPGPDRQIEQDVVNLDRVGPTLWQVNVEQRRMKGIWKRLVNLPLCHRILAGNSIFIVAGALGTMGVARYGSVGAGFLPLALFALSIVGLSLLANVWLLRIHLRSIERRDSEAAQFSTTEGDGLDVNRLAAAIDLMRCCLEDHQWYAPSSQVLDAREEWQRIAYELHNETSQVLDALLANLEVVEESIPDQLAQTRARLAATRALAAQTLEGVKQISDIRHQTSDVRRQTSDVRQ
jgi:signal transduction histidine kinase